MASLQHLSPLPPLLSALVLNYRSPAETIRCVNALLAQTIADQMEIIVIDNHSEDDSIGRIRNRFGKNPRVHIVETQRNIGYGRGNNEGERRASGTYILVINPDNELEPAGIERMIEAMETDASIGLLGPKLVYPDGTTRDAQRKFPTVTDIFIKRTLLRHFFHGRMDTYLQKKHDTNKVRDVDWVAGACFLVRRSDFETLGLFDPRYFLFFEDTDLCRRMWRSGKRVVYFPLVHATDRKNRLSEGGFLAVFTRWTMREHLRSAARYFWKWHGLREKEKGQREKGLSF